jgi:hypothetical protein
VNQYLKAILAITNLAFSKGMMAENMTENEYKAAIKSITAEYNSAKIDCGAFAGNNKNICLTVAKNQKKTAKAELNAAYAPSNEADYKVKIAKGNAEYAFALQKCDLPSSKEDCTKIAKVAMQHSKSEASAKLKTMLAIERYNNLLIDTHLNTKVEDY